MGLCIPENYLKIFDAKTEKRASGKKPLTPILPGTGTASLAEYTVSTSNFWNKFCSMQK